MPHASHPRALLAATIAAALALPPRLATQAAPSAQDSIRAAFLAWVRVAEAGDADGYMAFITDDAVLMFPGSPTLAGRTSILPAIRSIFSNVTFRFSDWQSEEIVVVGNLAVHRYSAVAEITPRTGGETTRQSRKYIDILRRGADGRWLVSHHIFNNNP